MVKLSRNGKLSGVMALRGVGGYGSSSIDSTEKIHQLSQDLPIVIEVVELGDRIKSVPPQLDQMTGLVRLEKVRALLYRPGK